MQLIKDIGFAASAVFTGMGLALLLAYSAGLTVAFAMYFGFICWGLAGLAAQ